ISPTEGLIPEALGDLRSSQVAWSGDHATTSSMWICIDSRTIAMIRRLPCLLAIFACLAAFFAGVEAAPPQVAKLSMPTLQSGVTTIVTVEGTDLLPNPRLILPVPIASQTVKEGATDKKVQFEVKLDNTVPPGVYQLRVGSDKGISGPVGIAI